MTGNDIYIETASMYSDRQPQALPAQNHPATDTMPRAPSVFLLLGGVASLPGATLVRYLAKKPASGLSVSRRVDLDADWEWVRLFGSASPAVQAKRPIRAAKPGRFIGL
ncbi:hypothetical protein VFPFJ_05837 [Purpureocillium lilacinum]|uniref:Uncharacterized protein n=3 Tax=Purpureocillium lilacinum TaxID=33203 RepID=A0A179HIH8_PURLI|nr:hypothetical protein VFPFJ_05837 [Purpureocillium lilacinum]OAQ89428.1 hypothetical protein VFPFJ_05837 [Purpureocillium lilacinum]